MLVLSYFALSVLSKCLLNLYIFFFLSFFLILIYYYYIFYNFFPFAFMSKYIFSSILSNWPIICQCKVWSSWNCSRDKWTQWLGPEHTVATWNLIIIYLGLHSNYFIIQNMIKDCICECVQFILTQHKLTKWMKWLVFGQTTLLKIKVLQKVLQAMPQKNHFWFHKEPFSQRFFKEPYLPYLFIIWRTFFHHKEPFVKQKGSSDVKSSLWNHLDKKVILCHREASLFLRVKLQTSSQ